MLKLQFIAKSDLVHSSTRIDLGLEVLKSVHAENVLVLSPHPDDETFGCGGLLKHLSSGGSKIKIIYFSDGSIGNIEGRRDYDLAREREEETFEALKIYSIHEVNFLRLNDANITFSENLSGRIYEEVKTRKYDLVLVPSGNDWSKTHQVVNLVFKTAYKKLGQNVPEAWEFFVWGINSPSYLFPIDKYLNYKKEAASCHKSQLKVKPYDEAFLAMNEYLGKGFAVSKYAEGYGVITKK